jgi:hypothetical protein
MKTYDIKITFKSKCSKEDLIDVDDLIYKFIKENFWNVENFKYEKESEDQVYIETLNGPEIRDNGKNYK